MFLSVFNAADHLPQAIHSVLAQSFADWDLLILDDGSTDPLVGEILEAVTDPRVSIMRFFPSEFERRQSVRYATNFNYGVNGSSSDYITFLCGDDYYMPDRFDRMVRTLDGGAEIVYGPQLLLDGDGHERGLRQGCMRLLDAFHRIDLNSVMMRRDLFLEVGGFPTDPGVWKDADGYLWRKITATGREFHPTGGGPTDAKRYRPNSVSDNVLAGRKPWHHDPDARSSAWVDWVPAA